MAINRKAAQSNQTKVVIVTADEAFEQSVRATFGAARYIDLDVIQGTLSSRSNDLDITAATVIVIDLVADDEAELPALEALTTRFADWPPVVVVTERFDQALARRLVQMRVADVLAKPVSPIELVRACARVAAKPSASERAKEAQIFAFLPAVGGAGVTTLAVQTAMLLLNSGGRAKTATCLVDLDFQHGACADYLDIEPRLNLGEIEPRPERLDRQLLEVMLSQHSSGLSVIAAPNSPAEMRSFNPDVVTRLLDLVSSHFDYVVFDMPRTWFSWTDNVLIGSNKLFIVSQPTVPGLRQTKQLVAAIRERLGENVSPQVIINRFVQSLLSGGLRRSDIEKVIGGPLLSCVPNDYALVREAIDRGVPLDDVKPGNKITLELKKLILTKETISTEKMADMSERKLKSSWVRSLSWARS